MIRIALAAAFLAVPAYASESKEQSCKYQGQVMAAVQQAGSAARDVTASPA